MSKYYSYDDRVEFSCLLGKTLLSRSVSRNKDEIELVTRCGERFVMCHLQGCCESVSLEDICGELADLIGSPITLAEEAVSNTRPPDIEPPEYEPYSQTWTFYRLGTAKGMVTIRWFGESNAALSGTGEKHLNERGI